MAILLIFLEKETGLMAYDNNYNDTWFVFFNTDKVIDNLMEIDISYQQYDYVLVLLVIVIEWNLLLRKIMLMILLLILEQLIQVVHMMVIFILIIMIL